MQRVFISYSWDSDEHKAWVLMLAEQLEREPGLTVRLDRWHLSPGASVTAYMEEIASADVCVLVCTPEYARKAEKRTAGVGYEAQIITAKLLAGSPDQRFVPIVRDGDFLKSIPAFLAGALAIDFRSDEGLPNSLEELLRTLFGQPRYVPPPKGDASVFTPAQHSERVTVGRGGASMAAPGDHLRPTISSEAARFGVTLGFMLGRFEFICDSKVPEAQAVEQKSRDELRAMVALENEESLIRACEGDARTLIDTIVRFYSFRNIGKHAAVLVGIGAQRFGLVGASKSEDLNSEMRQIPYSAFMEIDSSVVPDRRGLAEEISQLDQFVIPQVCDVLRRYAVA